MSDERRVYDWDDLIDISDDFDPRNIESVVLPEGSYKFSVLKVEKSSFNGSTKIPPCKMTKVYLRIYGGNRGNGLCTEVFFLVENMTWKAAAFLRCIGLKKHGEVIEWSKLMQCEGQSGECEIYVDQYTDKHGSVYECNKVREFITYEGRE